jgi:ribosome biogenesis protein MAK21
LSKNALSHIKNKVVTTLSTLFSAKPEQEARLLSMLVNKLGDLDRKIASKATHLLSQILIPHPSMKIILLNEVERLMLRPNIADRACYYAITFLNQIVLTKADESVANRLVNLYFSAFESMVRKLEARQVEVDTAPKKKDKKPRHVKVKQPKSKPHAQGKEKEALHLSAVHSKMMSQILAGVNRAFPFTSLSPETFSSHLNSLFQITHISNFSTSIQALSLILQVQSRDELISDRYYRSLYAMLFDYRLHSASKHASLLNLSYKSLKKDPSLARIQSFIKRLVQTLTHAQVPFICGSLFMIGQVMDQRSIFHMVTNPEENSDEADKKYDASKRDPLYSGATESCLWELVPFLSHFHPTVQLYASTLLSGSPILPPAGAQHYDPLANHTLTRFLDRFVYKAPKVVKSVYKGASIMQPRQVGKGALWSSKKRNVLVDGEMGDDYAVNDPRAPGVVDEAFYKTYFELRGAPKKAVKKFAREEAEGEDLGGEDFDENEVFEAMSKNMRTDELGEDDDDELSMDDLDILDDDEDDSEDGDMEELDEAQIAEMDFGKAGDIPELSDEGSNLDEDESMDGELGVAEEDDEFSGDDMEDWAAEEVFCLLS